MEGFYDDQYVPNDSFQIPEEYPPTKIYGFESENLPVDWSLKSSLSFQTDFQAAWTRTVPPHVLSVSNPTDFKQMWSHALIQYCYGIPTTAVSLRNWRNAFRSLYYSCRLGENKHFYLKGAEFTVLFQCRESGVAFISNATRSIRDKLKIGMVEFQRKIDDGDDDDDDDDRMFLEVKGNLNMNGLYEVLLDHFESQERDLPVLLSNTPFLNSTAVKARVDFPLIANQNTKYSRIFRIDVTFDHAWLLPISAKQLCDALALGGKTSGTRCAFKVKMKYGSAHMFPNSFVEEGELKDFVSPMQLVKYDTSHGVYEVYSNPQN
jgi:hypothetical protein